MKNVPIIGKFLAIIAIFGVFSIGVAFYATGQMRKIDNAYTSLIDHNETEATELIRGNRSLQTMRAAILEVVAARSDAGIASATAEINKSHATFEDYMDQAAKAATTDVADIKALKARGLQIVDGDCAASIAAGKASTTPAAIIAADDLFLQSCSPKFGPITEDFTTKAGQLVADANKQSDALTITTNTTIFTTFAVILGGLALVVSIAFFAIRSWITGPLRNLNGTMETLAKGDLTVVVSGEERKDEVGSMARTVQVFKEAGLDKVRIEAEAVEHRKEAEAERARNEAAREVAAKEQAQVVDSLATGLEKLSDGDLVFRLRETFAADYEKLRNDFNGAMDKLQETMKLVSANTSSIRGSTEEITQAADDLSKRTEQQAASLEETAAALDQITATVRRTAEGATEAREVVSTAKADAEHSGEVVRQAVEAMSGIEKSSQQISQRCCQTNANLSPLDGRVAGQPLARP
jgi:methyl-accepting chemotaxis protein